ncbi:MAG TPA: protein-L-isoaspartate O-methyltransferase family protein, partial [Candidatus Tripitaka californicus]|uniref:protein-L-isoaspartate O-methyltransferase family protein n=1 Tax=Candidatus Tripitaka californicus TaxID=3367616 RepID=UPI00402828C0
MKATLRLFLPLFLVLLLVQCLTANEEESFAKERKRMVEGQIEARGVVDKRVLRAMETVPRHLFVPEDMRAYSYMDTPLPIGSGQTISQPYIVAFMTELLSLKEGDKVLELGTGSGYQAA